MPNFTKHYSDKKFWEKLRNHALKAGRKVVEKALILYFCLQDPDTPLKAKAVITGALGYLILPIDAIPDIIPAAGFSDDLAALVTAITIVAIHIKPEHQDRAKSKLVQWFKDEPKLLSGPN